LGGNAPEKFETEIRSRDGRRVTLEINPRLIYRDGEPVGIQAIARDITGRDVAEMELRQAQKLESVGRLASGIAHEINTPMQFVGDNVRFLQDSFGELQGVIRKLHELCGPSLDKCHAPDLYAEIGRLDANLDSGYLLKEIPEALSQTLEGVDRVVTIVRAMKEFAHPESRGMIPADLNKALVNTLTVARNELKYVADVETEFGDLPLVICSLSDINQVFLNLLVNAAHAIGDVVGETGRKGTIHLQTQMEGSMALISIADTGAGIPAGIRDRIFDPFFTTKQVGRGTGQGLAIARSVVDRHKGTLTFESEVGKGTTFNIRLPIEGCECPGTARG
jgi:signal transduction histidine kinase